MICGIISFLLFQLVWGNYDYIFREASNSHLYVFTPLFKNRVEEFPKWTKLPMALYNHDERMSWSKIQFLNEKYDNLINIIRNPFFTERRTSGEYGITIVFHLTKYDRFTKYFFGEVDN